MERLPKKVTLATPFDRFWSKTVDFGQKPLKIIHFGSKPIQNGQNDQKSLKMVKNRQKWSKSVDFGLNPLKPIETPLRRVSDLGIPLGGSNFDRTGKNATFSKKFIRSAECQPEQLMD